MFMNLVRELRSFRPEVNSSNGVSPEMKDVSFYYRAKN